MRKKRLVVVTALVSALALVVVIAVSSAAAGQSKPPIKIGVVASLTGGFAGIGTTEKNGAVLAARQINAKGGVRGRKIELTILDDATNPTQGISATTRLLAENPTAIVGYAAGVTSIPSSAQLVRSKILALTWAGANPGQTTGKTLFAVGPLLTEYARALQCYATKAVKAKRVAMVNTTDAGTQLIFEELKRTLPRAGIQIVASETVSLGATDVTVVASKLRDANADLIIDGAAGTTGALIARTLRAQGVKTPILAYVGMAQAAVAQFGGSSINGIVAQGFLSAPDPKPTQAVFVRTWQRNYPTQPDHNSAIGYDSIYLVAEAIKRVPNATGKDGVKLARALENLIYQGVAARYQYKEFKPGNLAVHSGIQARDVLWLVARDGAYFRHSQQPTCP